MNFLQCILAGAQHFIAVTKQTSHGGSLSTLWRGRTYRREWLVLREWLTLMPTPGDSAREPSDEFCTGLRVWQCIWPAQANERLLT